MKNTNRDLLVLVRDENSNQQEINADVAKLNRLLLALETVDCFCTAHEIIDVNKYKIVQQKKELMRIIKASSLKPFQFLINKN